MKKYALVLLGLYTVNLHAIWLDEADWQNHALGMSSIPQAPVEKDIADTESFADRCASTIREAKTNAEAQLAAQGWMIFGGTVSAGNLSIVTAGASFDGMCRPLEYQAFVFMHNQIVGTLSPVLMNSRTDGALTTTHIKNQGHYSAQFNRYKEEDPMCCPSATSTVTYTLKNNEVWTRTIKTEQNKVESSENQ